MTDRRNFAALLLAGWALLAPAPAPRAQNSSAGAQDAVASEFRQALLRLAQAGQLPRDGAAVRIEQPAERVVNFGALVDRDDAAGLRVLGTLPGGSAERIGLRTGDRLIAANGVDLAGPGGSERMRGILDAADGRAPMELRVVREDRELQLSGPVEVIELPPLQVAVGSEAARADGEAGDTGVRSSGPASPGSPVGNSRCGRISTFDVAPRTRDLFPAQLIQIDGRLAGTTGQDSYRLTPGRHELTVAELIDERHFSAIANRQRSRTGADRYKTLVVDVEPGTTYLLAARFHRERSGAILDGGYWQPEIWSQRTEACG